MTKIEQIDKTKYTLKTDVRIKDKDNEGKLVLLPKGSEVTLTSEEAARPLYRNVLTKIGDVKVYTGTLEERNVLEEARVKSEQMIADAKSQVAMAKKQELIDAANVTADAMLEDAKKQAAAILEGIKPKKKAGRPPKDAKSEVKDAKSEGAEAPDAK